MRQFFAEIFIKRRFCSKKLCLLCCMLSACRLQFMIYHLSSLGFDFHVPIDFGFNVLFPHIFSVLHCNSVETSWFSLVIHGSPLTEEKSMPSSLDTRISMLSPPVSRRAHLRSQKKLIPKLKHLSFLLLDWSREGALKRWGLARPKRWGRPEFNATFSSGFGNGLT